MNLPNWLHLSENALWHIPGALIVAIYLPASLFGLYLFGDHYAVDFAVLLSVFALSYYLLYRPAARMLECLEIHSRLLSLGARVYWPLAAWIAVVAFCATIAGAALTTPVTPLQAALQGADLFEIAAARGEFLAKREGAEALLRYSAVILGRAVMPFLVAYLYWSNHRLRHLCLAGLLACYGVSLEKASPLFALLPLILLRSVEGKWWAALLHVTILTLCIGLWTFLALGGLREEARAQTTLPRSASAAQPAPPISVPPIPRYGDPRRHYIFYPIEAKGLWRFKEPPPDSYAARLMWITNRVIWIPYITAYDWLKFQDDVLHGRLTFGRSIGVVSWLMREPRLNLEQMVYWYQFGQSPGEAGSSNTVFFVDAKLAFGWPGAFLYCLLFPLFAAAVFSSGNRVAKVASVTSFFTASVSPLTATLLSGGLAFFILISLLTRTEPVPEHGRP